MFLFIDGELEILYIINVFQYISCSYLSCLVIFISSVCFIISIHLMFLFIPIFFHSFSTLYAFQYISCSYLSKLNILLSLHSHISIHLMFLFISSKSVKKRTLALFQYISCSYLSSCNNLFNSSYFVFQYISCSYLSCCVFCTGKLFCISIHLMFLFIQRFYALLILYNTQLSLIFQRFLAFLPTSCFFLNFS